MRELKLYAPTYNGNVTLPPGTAHAVPEFGEPFVPILARSADGIRIVLGSHDYFDNTAPDLQIERRPGGWAIFVHPMGGGDPCGCVYVLDDGRSFLVPERALSGTPDIRVLPWDGKVPGIDELPET